MADRDDISRKTVERLRNFSERLESGEPIPFRKVTVEQTPDGPLTTVEEFDDIWSHWEDIGGEG